MPIDPKKFKQDPRSPQELAKAILDHELDPHTPTTSSLTFREQLHQDFDHKPLGKHIAGLVWALKDVEEAIPLTSDTKSALRHGLRVIAQYRQERAFTRDFQEVLSNPDLAPKDEVLRASRAWFAPPADDERARRSLLEGMEESMIEIANLNQIEKLMRALAPKLAVSLIEPEQRKGRR